MADAQPAYRCPLCGGELAEHDEPGAVVWTCTPCNGLAMTLPVLRKLVAKEAVADLLRHIRGGRRESRRQCPACVRPMAEVNLPLLASLLVCDVCESCMMIWFDARDVERLPPLPPPGEQQLSPAAREAVALFEMQHPADTKRLKDDSGAEADGLEGGGSDLGRSTDFLFLKDVVAFLSKLFTR